MNSCPYMCAQIVGRTICALVGRFMSLTVGWMNPVAETMYGLTEFGYSARH